MTMLPPQNVPKSKSQGETVHNKDWAMMEFPMEFDKNNESQ